MDIYYMRKLMSICTTQNFDIVHINVKRTFLESKITEEIWVTLSDVLIIQRNIIEIHIDAKLRKSITSYQSL